MSYVLCMQSYSLEANQTPDVFNIRLNIEAMKRKSYLRTMVPMSMKRTDIRLCVLFLLRYLLRFEVTYYV